MKLVYKRSSAATAFAMPEEIPVSEPVRSSASGPATTRGVAETTPEPAPAGALHRVYPPGQVPARELGSDPSSDPGRDSGPDAYIPQRGSYGMRLRGGMPKSVGGRVVLACSVFAVLAAVALVAAAVRNFLLHDPRFLLNTSTNIAIEGNEHIGRPDILGVFGADLQRNIFRVPLAERRADLERLPWVEHATVMRLLPNHLRIQLKERTPVAFTRQGTQIGLVDGNGVLLDMPAESAGDPKYSFPVLTGLAPNDTPEIRASRMEVYRRFMSELAAAGPKVTQSLSEVDVTNPEDVKALITSGSTDILVHFGDEAFLQRYQAFERHLPEWRTQYPKLASADMRYERQVVLEMQPEGSAPLPSDMAIGGTGAPAANTRKFTDPAAPKPVVPAKAAGDRQVHIKAAAQHRMAESHRGKAARR